MNEQDVARSRLITREYKALQGLFTALIGLIYLAAGGLALIVRLRPRV
jgi:hypothetical protein